MLESTDYCPAQEKSISDYLFSQVGEENFLPGLDRIRPLFESYCCLLKEAGSQIITVGGTNGKGESCYALGQLLVLDGQSVGIWSSPHILSVRERFSFNGELASYDRLRCAVDEVLNRCRQLSLRVSYYELLFASFCQLALESRPKYLILEVGLGGRYDAVNLFEPSFTAITSISRDHQAILGDRLRDILAEKLGITRTGVPLVSFLESGYLRERVNKCASSGSFLHYDLQEFFSNVTDYSDRNHILALSLYTLIREGSFDSQLISQLLDKTDFCPFKGRREVVTYGERNYIFIGAHNVDGMRKLVQSELLFQEVLLSFSKRPLEDMKCGIKILKSAEIDVYLTTFNHSKAAPLDELEKLEAVHFVNDWRQFIDKQSAHMGTTVVAGSYYFIGEVQKYMSDKID